MQIAIFLVYFLQMLFGLVEWCVLLAVLYSWFRPHSASPFHRFLRSVVDPLYRIVRRVIPPLGPIDLSPILVLFGLELLFQLILRLISAIFV